MAYFCEKLGFGLRLGLVGLWLRLGLGPVFGLGLWLVSVVFIRLSGDSGR